MPTTPTAALRRAPTSGSRVLLGAAAVAAAAAGLLAVLGALLSGSAAAYGALVGGLIAVVVLAFGAFSVNMVAGLLPAASLMVALLTYALQILGVTVVLLALDRSAAVGDTLARGWLAGAVIGGTLVWMVAQVVGATRARIPVYDLPEPRATVHAAAAATGERRGNGGRS